VENAFYDAKINGAQCIRASNGTIVKNLGLVTELTISGFNIIIFFISSGIIDISYNSFD